MDQWLSDYGVTLGVGALIAFMIFIVWDLAKRSNAGKFGTIILYVGLAMGIFGFLIKVIITWMLENAGMPDRSTLSPWPPGYRQSSGRCCLPE